MKPARWRIVLAVVAAVVAAVVVDTVAEEATVVAVAATVVVVVAAATVVVVAAAAIVAAAAATVVATAAATTVVDAKTIAKATEFSVPDMGTFSSKAREEISGPFFIFRWLTDLIRLRSAAPFIQCFSN